MFSWSSEQICLVQKRKERTAKENSPTYITYDWNPSGPVPAVTIMVLLEVDIRNWPATHPDGVVTTVQGRGTLGGR